VGVQDAAVVIQARQGRYADALGLQLLNVGVDRGEPVRRKAFRICVLARRGFIGGRGRYEHEQGSHHKPAG
jgi:hypothetical protein